MVYIYRERTEREWKRDIIGLICVSVFCYLLLIGASIYLFLRIAGAL